MPSIRINPETHRLSSLPKEKHPERCQKCGDGPPAFMNRWQEHDHNDKPENIMVVLCNRCSKELIEPHPRLYRGLHENTPWPGCMAVCVDCKWRDGTRCSHKDAKANGGPGVMLSGMGEPVRALVDGPKYRGPVSFWLKPVTNCKQKETL